MMFNPLCGGCDPDLFKRVSDLQKDRWLKGEDIESSDV